MAAEIVQIDPQDLTSQIYESQDTNLIPTFDINTSLTSKSYIEYFIYDLNQNLLYTEYNFVQYKVLNDGQAAGTGVLSQIEINPEENLIDLGYDQGEYNTYYNFLNKQIGSELQQLYITEISSDRTELRLDSTSLTNIDIVEQTTSFINERENSDYFLDFYVNFGDNLLYIANNIVLDNQDPNNPTILIKLYEPLPDSFSINSTLWVVTSVEEPIAYRVSFISEPIVFDDTIKIKGPNFNIELKDQVNNSTQELTYADLITTSLTSSQNQLNSLLEEKEIDINIDWTNFEDFIHFSSAQTRLENFYYKVSLIEQYSSSISIIESNITGSTSSSLAVSESKTILESKINNIITNFDGWDYYLYYSSGSWAWPKINTEPPYQLATTGSTLALNWYNGIISSASYYDNNNKDNLLFSIPEYLREDPDNAPYELFIDMVAQHFDNIWIYYKDVTQKFNADNRLESGISKDIVADAIRDFGIKLYQNNFSNQDLYTAFLGLTPEGGLFPFPNITGSLPTPSGFEYVDTLISASNDYLPLDDVNKSLYKRIYHNLPYLLKSKGTLPGLRALITSYGIPDTILRINEYGGKDKVDSNDWDYWQNEFNYAYSTEENNFISSSWVLHPDWYSPNGVPSTLTFRFQTPGLPYTNIRYSQSLWSNDIGSSIVLTYTGSAYSTGSYSGSIIDPYYQYATLTFYPNTSFPTTSSNIYLPFFDGGWWSVMVNRSGSEFTLSAANKLYEGGDNGTILGFYETSSIVGDPTPWINSIYSYFPISFSVGSLFGYDVVTYDNTAIYDGTGSFVGSYVPFSGSYQEIRYYNTVITPNVFKDYTMNPYSTEGNTLNSSPNELAFRAPIGGELYTGSVSVHPQITGSWQITQSFRGHSNFYYDTTPIFKPNIEYFFFDQPIAGIKNAVSDKIRLENDNIPSGSVLSPFRRLAQTTEASASYTPNINLLEVAFSPQDEINDDINSQIGLFNIGNFIGDPAFRSSHLTSYPDLDQLRNEYFEKYTKNYNLVDFIRLIKFFDNSLFKMIRDFVPARTSLASGVVIKQHLLERNRYPQPQADNHTTIAKYGRSGSIIWNEPIIVQDITITGSVNPQWNDYNPGTIENFSGGTGGSFEIFNGIDTSPYGADGNGPDNRFGITQSWNETYPTLSGSVTIVHDSQDEFYNGEFYGSTIIVTTQSLNQPYPSNYTSFGYKPVHYYPTTAAIEGASQLQDWFDLFITPITSPPPGEIYFLEQKIGTLYTTYIKVAKIDCNGNDNTNVLENATSILVYNNILNTYFEYKVTLFGEGADYFLYKCENPLQPFNDTIFPNQILNYTISGSITNSVTISPFGSLLFQPTASIDGLNYYDSSSGYTTFGNTPNTRLRMTSSITVNASTTTLIYYWYVNTIYLNDIGSAPAGTIFNVFNAPAGTSTHVLTGSFYPLEGESYILVIATPFEPNSTTIQNVQFLITQSRAVETVSCSPIAFFEPNITEANFYNSDENALINNVVDNRQSSVYQDVDYTQGALVPVNFEAILSGSAVKAAVQDSNYTLRRHINPRYNGSRTTSLKLNVWTSQSNNYEGDTNTFGKLSTIDSTKTYVAYCNNFTGWSPERMNTSALIISYLIGEDGSVVIPDTSDNSLYINKGTFESGEKITISSPTVQGLQEYYTVFRGGTSPEPILYTQSGSVPNIKWTSSIVLYDESSPANITDNTAKAILNPLTPSNPYGQNITALLTPIGWPSAASWNVIYDLYGRWGTYEYNVDSTTITEGCNLIIDAQFIIENTFDNAIEIVILPCKNNDPTPLSPAEYYTIQPNTSITLNYNYNLTPEVDFISTDEFFFQIKRNTTPIGIGGLGIVANGSYFNITQFPLPNPLPPITVGTGSIWNYPTSASWSQYSSSQAGIIYIPDTGSSLNAYYNAPYVKQQNIQGSGFNSITLPWSIKYGDEFRFEGREDRVFTVKKVYGPEDQSPERISPTGSVEVHLNSALPSASINPDHFLIRRYIDDASSILINGLRPSGAPGDGPWLVKPEFVSPALNKSIDQFIVDLTQKGLL